MTIVFVCVIHLTAIQFRIFKKHSVCAQMSSSFSCPCFANEWITPAFTFVQWNSMWWYSIFWTPAKNILDKWNYMTIKNRKEKKVLVHWFCEGTTKNKNLSSIKWRFGLLMQSSKMPWMSPRNVCVRWLHNITSQEWRVIGLVCVNVLVYVIEGMPHLSWACADFPGCPGDVWDPSCLLVNDNEKRGSRLTGSDCDFHQHCLVSF